MSWEKGDVSDRVSKCRGDLKSIQFAMEKDPDNAKLRNKSCELLNEYNIARKEEDNMLYQKEKVEWLNEGDRNTSFFHKILKERKHRSKITAICDESGKRYENDEVADQFLKHFKEFLEKEDKKVSDKEALFDIEDDKVPGPDGFTSKFFKETWDTLRNEVCQAVQQFFDTRKLLGEVNATVISLVPKIKTPNKVSDYRPIACCNVIYKCISKILTNKMKSVLRKLVDENQSAFIAGRQITDNILLAHELLRGYNRKSSRKKCAFKIDLQKAYDTINWDFLGKSLSGFGFHSKWIKWVMTCITTAKFTINVNGDIVGYFNGGRGLRQGDPIAPYLFTLVMEVLNLLMKKNIIEAVNFRYHFGCKRQKITHIYFVDDLMVFCNGDISLAKVIKRTLEEFSGISGLKPNMQKSTVFFGGMNVMEQNNILKIIPFFVGKFPMKYLGVPLIKIQLNVSECKPLVEKVEKKILDWKNRALTYAGRLQLIASVLSSMQMYWALVFLIPKTVINEINKLLKRFLWCQGELIKGKAKVLWDSICKPKDQGGLGLKDLHKWNETLLLKLLWNVAAKKDTLWVKWINVEKQKGRNLWDMQIDSNSSLTWKTFLGTRDKIRDHIWVEIGNGKSTSVWYDNCHSMGPLCSVVTKRDVYDARMTDKCTVEEAIARGSWIWPSDWVDKFPMLKTYRVPNLKELKSDVTKWKENNERLVDFSIKQAWKDRNAEGMRVNWKDMVCDSHDHLFFNCRYSEIIWKKMQTKLCRKFSMNWQTVIVEMSQLKGSKNIWCIVSKLVCGAIELGECKGERVQCSKESGRTVEDKTAKTQEED
ncbi:RNA-directed DNA polymerase, eukaryota, reverse transcriptase zinc-binding domain protein [Tanacetum coccineum]